MHGWQCHVQLEIRVRIRLRPLRETDRREEKGQTTLTYSLIVYNYS